MSRRRKPPREPGPTVVIDEVTAPIDIDAVRQYQTEAALLCAAVPLDQYPGGPG